MYGDIGTGPLLIGLVIAVFLGLIPANIAKKKGYSFGLWWLLGFLFFLPVLIIALVMKDKTVPVSVVPKQEEHIPGMVKCPHCQSNIKPEAAVCNYCGEKVK